MYEIWIVEREHEKQDGMWWADKSFLDREEAEDYCKRTDGRTRVVYIYAIEGIFLEDEPSCN